MTFTSPYMTNAHIPSECGSPAYSPNLNLIERLWRFVKKQVLYSTHYDMFATFKESNDACPRDIGTRFKSKMQTLMTMNFQPFSKPGKCAAYKVYVDIQRNVTKN